VNVARRSHAFDSATVTRPFTFSSGNECVVSSRHGRRRLRRQDTRRSPQDKRYDKRLERDRAYLLEDERRQREADFQRETLLEALQDRFVASNAAITERESASASDATSTLLLAFVSQLGIRRGNVHSCSSELANSESEASHEVCRSASAADEGDDDCDRYQEDDKVDHVSVVFPAAWTPTPPACHQPSGVYELGRRRGTRCGTDAIGQFPLRTDGAWGNAAGPPSEVVSLFWRCPPAMTPTSTISPETTAGFRRAVRAPEGRARRQRRFESRP